MKIKNLISKALFNEYMLLDSTVLSKEKINEIAKLVGPAYTIWDSLRLKGIGSTKLNISGYSDDFKGFLELDSNNNYCNIELRPNGIIVHLNKRATRYSWAIPFYKLSLFHSDDYSIHSNGKFLRIQKDDLAQKSRSFINKILEQKAQKSKINPF